MPRDKNEAPLQSATLLTIKRDVNEQKGTELVIRVVDWFKAGGKHTKQLEKREMFVDKSTGELKNGKAKGFNREELLLVQDKWGEIMDALTGKPAGTTTAPPPTEQPAAAPIGAETDF